MVSFNDIKLDDYVMYVEKLIKIVTREERKLRTKMISMVKVILQQDRMKEEETWKVERDVESLSPS